MSQAVEQKSEIIDNRVSIEDAPGHAYIDGHYGTLAEAKLPVLDFGFIRGDCVYDAIPLKDGRLYRVSDHLDRFWESMGKWRLPNPVTKQEARTICHELVRRSGLKDGLLLMITTRGVPPCLKERNPLHCTGSFYAYVQPVPSISGPENENKGLKVSISKIRRTPDTSIDSTAKNFQHGDMMQSLMNAKEEGLDTTILLDYDGNVAEGPGFNIIVVHGNTVRTPARHCLKGITRRSILEIAQSMGMDASEGTVSRDMLLSADEVFLSSSAGGIFPVAEIDGQTIGNAISKPVYERISREYWNRRTSPDWSEAVDYT